MIEMNYNILLLSGSDVGVYNCGEMSSEEPDLETHSICGEGKNQVIYAWAMDAPSLELPDGVGFRVGGDSGINYLVLQVSQNIFFYSKIVQYRCSPKSKNPVNSLSSV